MIEGAFRRIDPDQSSGFSFVEFVGTLEISKADVKLSCYCYCTATVTFVSQEISTWSPTLILSSTVGSATRRLYFHPFGPVKVIDCALLSMELIDAVIVLSTSAVPPGRSPCPAVEPVVAVLTEGSPGGFSLAETVLLYVIDTLSPTLSSSNRFALVGTSIVWNLPSGVLMFTTRLV